MDAETLTGALLSSGAIALPDAGGLAVRAAGLHTVGGIAADASIVAPSVPTVAAEANAVVAAILAGH